MTHEIDHIFIMCAQGATTADRLVAAGITEGTSREHPGQGTTNRRFFFRNIMLEFLWVHDPDETASEVVRPTYLLERWQGRAGDASPYGVCFRTGEGDDMTTPFAAWDYKPPYLPPHLAIQVATNAGNLQEPFLFYLAWATAPDPAQVPTHHAAGIEMLTNVDIHHPPFNSVSAPVQAIASYVTFVDAEAHHMTLTFDGARQGKTLDLRPDVPLMLVY